jgi:ABC-type uncharacterized transport system substrate-binding protein
MTKKVLYVFMLTASSFRLSAVSAPPVNDILVIHSYHQGLQWTDDISEGIRSVLRSESVEIHHEFLDMKRNSGEEYYRLIVDFERRKEEISQIDFKLIICSDNHALEFIMEYGEELYPGVPVVFCGVNNFSPGMIAGRNDITGIVETIDYRRNLDLIHYLHPERKNFLFIIDNTVSGQKIVAELKEILKGYPAEYRFEIYDDFLFDEVPGRISDLGEEDVIVLLTFNRDRSGRFLSYVDGIEMIHQYSRVPIYGAWDFFFGLGIIGGVLTTGHAQGAAAAEMAKAILGGAEIRDLPISQGRENSMMFDYTELKRFGIDLNKLPEGSLIINEPESLVRRMAYHILAGSILILLILCIAAVRLIRNSIRETQLREMNRELEKGVRKKTADLTEKVDFIEKQNSELQSALVQIKTLQGIIPICSKCKKIRNDKGYWDQVEQFIAEHTEAEFSHGLCPDCFDQLFQDAKDRKARQEKG